MNPSGIVFGQGASLNVPASFTATTANQIRMIHLATHGVFNPGDRSNSYIQLWDQKLRLDQLDQLNWGNPPVDLLVLSACQTALGDKDAELGFARLAINAGVRSALASLWEVNDAATLGLMTKFYQQLQVIPFC